MFRRISILFVVAYFIFLLNGYSYLGSPIYLWDGQIKITNTIIWNELLTMIVVGFLLSIGVFSRIEIYMILLTGLVGIINMISSNDFLVTLLSLQLINVSFYLLLGTNKTSEAALSAAFKYLLLSAFTTTIFLAGVISLYANYGTLNYDSLFIASNMNPTADWVLLLLVGAVVFKLGAAPFHFWGPDVYDNSPTIYTAWLITLPKLALLSFLVAIFPLISENILAYFLGPVAFLSVIIGSIGLGAQERIKRLLAFSTISHMGFLMFALVTMDLNTFSFYYAIYLLTTVSLFGCLLAFGGRSVNMITQLSGMYLLNPALAIVFAISFFSLAGIPPLAGFFAKLWVLFSLVRFDFIFYALVLVVTSTISTAYYLRIIKISFLDLPVIKETNLTVSSNASVIISLVTMMLVFFMFKPSTLISLFTIV
jgi:proton-translocating NADH-quinone oxidoreductase chain N